MKTSTTVFYPANPPYQIVKGDPVNVPFVQPTPTTAAIREKNCTQWAMYEEGSSGTAALCNGGWFDGKWKKECPAKPECRTASINAGSYVPVQNLTRPQATSFSPQIVASTPNLQGPIRAPAPGSSFWNITNTLPSAANGQQARQPQTMQAQVQNQARPPQPQLGQPVSQHLQTPFMPYHPPQIGGVTPTFLPVHGESVFSRLIRNIIQGFFGAMGWHIFDFTRTVDFFPHIPQHPLIPPTPPPAKQDNR